MSGLTQEETKTKRFTSTSEKFLTFTLAAEDYGIEVLKIREIIRVQKITPVPQMPHHVKGVINLRGKVIPVIDLRLKFGLEAAEITERTCIIVVDVDSANSTSLLLGLIVDAVQEVLNISGDEVEDAPDFGNGQISSAIMGMAKIKGSVKTLLDIEKVVCDEMLHV